MRKSELRRDAHVDRFPPEVKDLLASNSREQSLWYSGEVAVQSCVVILGEGVKSDISAQQKCRILKKVSKKQQKNPSKLNMLSPNALVLQSKKKYKYNSCAILLTGNNNRKLLVLFPLLPVGAVFSAYTKVKGSEKLRIQRLSF